MSTEEKFHAAVNVIRNLPKNGAYQPSHDLKLKFYAYFKQATEGPCSISKPSFWDIVGKTKYDAWHKLGNMTKVEAMENYVEELKKIVETMSYNDNIGMFLGSLGNFYDNVPVEDIEMLLGPVIDRVRASPGSPLQNSPLGSRETSPTRVPRHLVNKTNISSLETSPISSMSPSPQPPDTDDENEEFIDTVETTPNAIRKVYKNDATNGRNSDMFECNGSKEKCERNGKTPKMNGHVISNPRTINSTSVQNGKGGHTNGLSLDEDSEGPARTKSRERESPNVTKRRMVKQNGEIQTDLSEPLREAVLHLQKDLDRITARVRSLEVCMLSQPLAFQEVELCNSCDANLTTQIDEFEDCIQIPVKSLVEGEPTKDLNKSKLFPELSRKTLLFVVVWPFLAHFLMRFLQTKKIKNCKPFTRSMLFSFSVRARYILAPSAS